MIQSKQDYEFYLQQDRKMNSWPLHPSFASRVKSIFSPNMIKRYLFWLRKAEYYTNCHKHSILWGGYAGLCIVN